MASFDPYDRFPWRVLGACVNIATLAPQLQKVGLCTEEELQQPKDWWNALPRDQAAENLFAGLKGKGPDSFTKFVQALRSSLDEESTPAHQQLLGYAEELDRETTLSLLDPVAYLEWRKCRDFPGSIRDAQAVLIGDKVYLGGTIKLPATQEPDLAKNIQSNIFSYDLKVDVWDKLHSPASHSALAVYRESLALLGGKDACTGKITNRVWILEDAWNDSVVPSMCEPCWRATAISMDDYLFVAGGVSEGFPLQFYQTVQVYDRYSWALAQPLPIGLYFAKSTIHDGSWYLCGGYGQRRKVIYASLKDILSEKQLGVPYWNYLAADVPFQHSYLTTFQDHVLNVGGDEVYKQISVMYSRDKVAWTRIAGLPLANLPSCVVTLPTGELMVVGSGGGEQGASQVFRGNIRVSKESALEGLERTKPAALPLPRQKSMEEPVSVLIEKLLSIEQALGKFEDTATKRSLKDRLLEKSDRLARTVLSTGGPEIKGTDFVRGLDVTSEASFSVTNKRQTFHWKQQGLKLHFRKDSLPKGTSSCQVQVKVALSGQFELPHDSVLVSAIYWLYSPVKFRHLVTLEMQHCGQPQEKPRLEFVVAKCSQKQLPYRFKHLSHGVFTDHSPHGSIDLSHFSILGVVVRKLAPSFLERPPEEQRSYWACLFYSDVQTHPKIHLVVTWNTEPHISVVRKEYAELNAEVGADLEIEFERDCREITMEMAARDDGWHFVFLTPSLITKEQIDNYNPGRRIPNCQLQTRWTGEDTPDDLFHRIQLLGAKKPFNFLTISILRDNRYRGPGVKRRLPQEHIDLPFNGTGGGVKGRWAQEHDLPLDGTDVSVLYSKGTASEPELPHLMNEIAAKIPDKWRLFGIQLNLQLGELEGISYAHRGIALECFATVFRMWKERADTGTCTWKTVITALQSKSIGELRIAAYLTQKFSQYM